jgi:hypothetical protein
MGSVKKGFFMESSNLIKDIKVVKVMEKFAVSGEVNEYKKDDPVIATRSTYSIFVEKDQSGCLTVAPFHGDSRKMFEFRCSSPVTVKAIAELLIKASEL